MPDNEQLYEALKEFIRQKLQLSVHARYNTEFMIKENIIRIRPHLVIDDGRDRYIVEVKKKLSIAAIATINLYKDLIEKHRDKYHYHFLIICKVSAPLEEALAKAAGIGVLILPRGARVAGIDETKPSAGIKLTSAKSWTVISSLFKEKTTSIRQLALKNNVSYGWAHKTIEALLSQGIAVRKDGYITIGDASRLLNGIAWERPFENLFIREIKTNRKSAFDAARYISQVATNARVDCAFTSYTAAGLYTGYAVRGDTAYAYVKKEDIDGLIDLLSEDIVKDGVAIRIYAPDRDVFKKTRELEGVKVVSPAQTLLDTAGLGYGSKDVTMKMVERYAAL